MEKEKIKIFSGTANPAIAGKIAESLDMELGAVEIKRFSDGEIKVVVKDNVRRKRVYVIQPTCMPVNENLMELLIFADALKRASVDKIIAVMPYFGYARQDRKAEGRSPISAKLVADLINASGISHVITLDLHASQIQGFFNLPVDHLYAKPVFLDHICGRFREHLQDVVIIAADAGGVAQARSYAKRLNARIAIVDKWREGDNKARALSLRGSLKDKLAFIVDDMVDTAGTLTEAANLVMSQGAKSVSAYCTHAVLSGLAVERISNSVLENVFVSDSILLSTAAAACSKIKSLSVAQLIARAIKEIETDDGSVSSLFV